VKHEVYNWNAHTIPNPTNPYWGDIWVRNMRSKDDVPHILRTVPMLMRLANEAPDEDVREAASLALKYLRGFAKDIVDSGFYIRTKEVGDAYVPRDSYGVVADLASYVNYEWIVSDAECNSKLATVLVAYGEPMGVNCGIGFGSIYEEIATKQHYFNYDIIRYFHIAATTNALMNWQVDVARTLLEGLAMRADARMNGEGNWENYPQWNADLAAFLTAAATAGLPLTSREARLVMEMYSKAVDYYSTWPYWDLWDDSVPDGVYNYKPGRDAPDGPVPRIEEMAYIIEYCFSPFKNPTTKEFVDCEIVADPDRWGE